MLKSTIDWVSSLLSPSAKRTFFPDEGENNDEIVKENSTAAVKRPRLEDDDGNEDSADRRETKYLHRVRVSNLPQEPMKKIKNFFKSYDINRVSKDPQKREAYLAFETEEEAQKAIKKLEGVVFKKRELTLQYLQISEESHRNRFNKKKAKAAKTEEKEEEDTRTPAERIADQVTPLHKKPYEQQLKKKERTTQKHLNKLIMRLKAFKEVQEKNKLSWIHEKSPVQIESIIPSPVINGYRSKCEFTIGTDLEGVPTVGFKLGLFRHGVMAVLNASDCLNVSDTIRKIANAMQDYARSSEHAVYNQETHKGVWRILMTKVQRTGDVMVLVQARTTDLSTEQVNAEKKKLTEFWNSLKEKDEANRVDVTTLLFQTWNGVSNGADASAETDILIGDGHIYEEILGCRFRISNDAFFQVNTPATELLYAKCAEWCSVDSKTTLLDLCCGTGTIGITMAKSVDRVIGVEMVPEAIEDARANAARNNITNVDYYASTVENRLDLLGASSGGDVVAVLDPPRNGVKKEVIKAIRAADAINRVVYISCDASQALDNFADLCRPSSNNFRGMPFKPKRMVAVDLFPHTEQFELMIEFVRIDASDLLHSE